MFLGAAILVALLLAWALGLRASNIERIQVRGGALVFVALGLQLLLFVEPFSFVSGLLEEILHVASYLMLIAFLLANRRAGLFVAAAGLALNTLVIAVNGGRMPISLRAWTATGRDPVAITGTGSYNNNVLAGPHSHLTWLGDVFALPGSVPFATAISIGDLLILAGMTVLVVSGDRSPWTRMGLLREPLRVAPFRRLIGGRAISDVGDLLTMTAVVTWLFEREHSVALVSAFLIVRILASSAGGLAAASLLDRLPYFRTLAIVEVGRATLTAGILAAAVTGQLAAVFLLVCVSAAVGSATSPSAASLVPELLPARLVPAGNGLHGVASTCAFILGAALGSVSVGVLGIGPALAIDLASFLLAATLYRSFAQAPDEKEPAMHANAELPAPRREILHVLVSDGVLVGLTASFTVVTAAMGLLNASLPAFLSEHLSEPEAYGYGLAAIAAGLFCGELLASLLPEGRIARRSVALAFAGSAAILYTASTTSVAATVYLLLFLLGCADGTTEIVRDSLFQRHLEPRLRAGGFAVANALQRLGMACGFAAAPLVALLFGTAAGLRVSAVACLAGALIAGLLLVVRFRRRPAALDSATLAEPV